MRLRSVSAILFSSIAFISTSNLTHAQSSSPAELLAAMKQGNINIENDVKNIQTRCANQEKRKMLLEQEIVKRQPQLTQLTASKTALTELQKQKDATLEAKTKELAALRASITELQDAIKNEKTSTTTRLATLRTERDAAKKIVLDTTKNINTVDDFFETWKDEGSNEFTLYRAQFKDENNKLLPPEQRLALTALEQSALDYLKSYDSMRSALVQVRTTNEATVTQKEKAIADLTAGRRDTVQDLQRKLAEKQGAVSGAIAAVTAAQVDFNRTQADVRSVSARIATLSSIVIPNIPTVCTFINQMGTPRV